MHDAFTEHKVYEYREIKSAATDPDYLKNIEKARMVVDAALKKKNVDHKDKYIAILFNVHPARWSSREIYK